MEDWEAAFREKSERRARRSRRHRIIRRGVLLILLAGLILLGLWAFDQLVHNWLGWI